MTVSPDRRWTLVRLHQGHPDLMMMIDNFR
jgi:hypothetical protein